MQHSHTRKIGMNRGKPRIWLEGKELTDFGIHHGMRYNVQPINNGLAIAINPEGKRKIAGTKGRPIIDMTGRTVEAGGFAAGDTFEIVKALDVKGIILRRLD